MGEMGYFLMVLPCCPIWLSRKDLNSVTMVIMEWLWKSIGFSQLLCKRVIAIRWTFIPPNPNPNPNRERLLLLKLNTVRSTVVRQTQTNSTLDLPNGIRRLKAVDKLMVRNAWDT